MYSFELDFAKFEDHNAAIDTETYTISKWPTIRIKADEDKYILGISIHKWELQPSGKAIAIFQIGTPIHKDDKFWSVPKDSQYFQTIQETFSKKIKEITDNNIESFVEKLENGQYNEQIQVYKYHASQWRQIEKAKSKWAYKEKAVKSEICNIQRLLN